MIQSRPARGARIEMSPSCHFSRNRSSRPARGARIEIIKNTYKIEMAEVAPRKGRED